MKTGKHSVLALFIVRYLVMIVFFILLTIPILFTIFNSEKKSIIDKSSREIHDNILQFKKSTDNLSAINLVLENFSYFDDIKYLQTNTIPSELYYKLAKTRELLRQLTYSDPLVKDVCIHFNQNDFVISRFNIMHSNEETDIYYIPKDENTEKLFEEYLWTNQNGIFMTQGSFSLKDNKKTYTPYISASQTNFHRVVCFYDNAALSELFDIKTLPQNSFFYIADFNGNLILDSNFSNQVPLKYQPDNICDINKFTVFTQPISGSNYYVSIGIPHSFFFEKMTPIIRLIIIYLVMIISLGIILAIILAFKTYAPLKKLVAFSADTTKVSLDSKVDEYTYLHTAMNNASQANIVLSKEVEKMEKSLKSHLIIRCVLGQLYAQEEYAKVNSLFPQLSNGYRVAMAIARDTDDIDSENKKIADTLLYSELKRSMPKSCIIEQIGESKTIVIFAEDKDYLDIFFRTVKTVNANLNQLYKLFVDAGISHVTKDAEKMSLALEQATSALSVAKSSVGNAVLYTQQLDVLPATLTIERLQRIYMLAYTGNKESILAELSTIETVITNNPAFLRKQIFYTLCYILSMLISDKGIEKKEELIPHYSDTDTASSTCNKLSEAFSCICDKIISSNLTKTDGLYSEICNYIHKNFGSSDLCVPSIADYFKTNEKQIYLIFKKSSDLSPSEYILKARMDYAVVSIKETTATIATISQECGFNSTNTFHKAFKKYFGVSPLSYRE